MSTINTHLNENIAVPLILKFTFVFAVDRHLDLDFEGRKKSHVLMMSHNLSPMLSASSETSTCGGGEIQISRGM